MIEKQTITFLDQIKDFVVIVDSKYKIIYANPYCLKYLSYKEDQLLGTSFQELLPKNRRSCKTLFFSKKTKPQSIELISKKNESCFLKIRVLDFDISPKEKGFLLGGHDQTEKILERKVLDITREIQQTIKKDQYNLNTTLQTILTGALYLSKMEGGGIYLKNNINKSFDLEAHTNLNPEYIEQIKSLSVNSQQGRFLLLKKPFYGDISKIVKFEAKKFDYKSLIIVPILLDDDVIGSLNLASKNNTIVTNAIKIGIETLADKISTTLQFIRLEQQRVEEKERLDLALQNSDMALWDWDIPTDTVKFNEKFQKEIEDFIPGKLQITSQMQSWTELIHEDDQPAFRKELMVHFEGYTDYAETTFRVTKADGQENWILARGRVIERAENSMPLRMVGVCLDISKQKNAELENKQMQKQLMLTSKLASIGEMSAGIAHEINNPLAIIKGFLDLLKVNYSKNKLTDEIFWKAIKTQEQSIERITNIVNGLRVYSRMELSDSNNFNIHKIIKNSIDLIKTIYSNASIEIVTNLDAKSQIIKGNLGKFQQVLMNLFSNAKHSINSCKKPDGKIIIRTFNKDDNIFIEVEDNGDGIDQAQMARIFDAFYTTKPIGEGTGLGLSIVHSIIQEMKGNIEVQSTPQRMTIFRISLPLSKEREDVLVKTKKQSAEGLSGSALVIDDESDILLLVKNILETFGITEITTINNSEEAITLLKKSSFDFILVDNHMPKMSGREIIKTIKNENLAKNSKIFMLTGSLEKDFEDVNGVIEKPFSQNDMFEILKNAR